MRRHVWIVEMDSWTVGHDAGEEARLATFAESRAAHGKLVVGSLARRDRGSEDDHDHESMGLWEGAPFLALWPGTTS